MVADVTGRPLLMRRMTSTIDKKDRNGAVDDLDDRRNDRKGAEDDLNVRRNDRKEAADDLNDRRNDRKGAADDFDDRRDDRNEAADDLDDRRNDRKDVAEASDVRQMGAVGLAGWPTVNGWSPSSRRSRIAGTRRPARHTWGSGGAGRRSMPCAGRPPPCRG